MGGIMKTLLIFYTLLFSLSCLSEESAPPAPHKDSPLSSGRSEAEGTADPREKKGADRFFKSFESLEGEKK